MLIPAFAVLALLGACGSNDAPEPEVDDAPTPSTAEDSMGLADRDTGSSALPPSAGQFPLDSVPTDVDRARAVIEEYYAAINEKDYRRAFAQWSDEGRSSGKTFDEFADGFEDTERVRVTVGEAGRVEGAAGSRYVDIPVIVEAETRSGVEQRFEGNYTLRRAVVDGATPAQRRWHFYRAELHEVR